MSPTIRVDEEVYASLQGKATPFVDTPNSVLRRLLNLGPSHEDPMPALEQEIIGLRARVGSDRPAKRRRRATHSGGKRGGPNQQKMQERSRAPSGVLLSEGEYVIPLLSTLEERGGSAHVGEVIEAVGSKLESRLTELDRARVRSGGVRWQGRVQFVRLRLLEQGFIKKNSSRGIWEISDSGRAYLASAGERNDGS